LWVEKISSLSESSLSAQSLLSVFIEVGGFSSDFAICFAASFSFYIKD
jgi:hypothetical protein